MKTKNKSVNIKDLQPVFAKYLPEIEKEIKRVLGSQYEMTITSGKDGKHVQGSKHYRGLAIDIRTKDMMKVCDVVAALKSRFYRQLDIVYEVDHVHAEYEPR